MNKENRQHGLALLERYAKEQDHVSCILRQIEECKGSSESQALQDMLRLGLIENRQNQVTIRKAFRFLLELDQRLR
jgi:hypothetical protein